MGIDLLPAALNSEEYKSPTRPLLFWQVPIPHRPNTDLCVIGLLAIFAPLAD
jgi:hypothetical protein